MEQIRRANRLWASDSLFVRETLLIPAEGEAAAAAAVVSPGGFSADSGHSSDDGGSSGSEPAILREEPPRRVSAPVVTRDQSDASLEDFLGKIDTAIARTKYQVAKHRGASDLKILYKNKPEWFWSGEDLCTQTRRKPAVSRLRQNQSEQVTTVQPGSRRVRTSLQRLEQTQDELFQL
ncbi:hypothetical protein B566_EDAN007108 [Ephemera danica]|nr:hypothetical protein B566_EDAN007108 [Ephemera danica]